MDSMKTKTGKEKKGKRKYSKPAIEIIKLDNEISLVMGTPPGDPEKTYPDDDEGKNIMNPFKLQKL